MKFSSFSTAPQLAVSHNANIKKQSLLVRGDVDRVTNFSKAVFPPGEMAPSHCHRDMTEIFFVQSGRGEIQVDDVLVFLEPGSCVTVEPGEYHELRNSGHEEMVVLYFGIEP